MVEKQDVDTETSNTDARPMGLSLTRILVVLSGLVALASPLYLYGLFSTHRYLEQAYDLDPSMSWYAGSLIPAPVVASRSIQDFLTPSLLLAIPFVIGTGVVVWQVLQRNHRRRWLFVAILGALAWITIIFSPEYYRAFYPPTNGGQRALLVLSVSLVLASGGMLIGVGGFFIIRMIRDVRAGIPVPRRSWMLLAAAYPVIFVVAYFQPAPPTTDRPPIYLHLGAAPPQLPSIVLYVEGRSPIEGDLLAHADQYWYVFTNPDGVFLAISDSKVEMVRMSPQRERAASNLGTYE